MRATWRPLPAWPYEPRPKAIVGFRVGWDQAIDELGDEIALLGATDVIIGVVVDDSLVRLDGSIKGSVEHRATHPGAEVSFDLPDTPDRRVTFHTDAYKSLKDNLRAIGLGLEALRAVDRYGITSTGEQYAGFAMLSDGAPDAERGRALVAEAGGVANALKRHHPDKGGDQRAFRDVQAYRALAAGKGR